MRAARAYPRAHRFTLPTTQVDRGGPSAPRRVIAYWCAADHRTAVPLASDIDPPLVWQCSSCGAGAVRERGTAPVTVRPRVFPRTPYEFLMMRRTAEEGDRLLAEAVQKLRQDRRKPR